MASHYKVILIETTVEQSSSAEEETGMLEASFPTLQRALAFQADLVKELPECHTELIHMTEGDIVTLDPPVPPSTPVKDLFFETYQEQQEPEEKPARSFFWKLPLLKRFRQQ